MEDVASGGELSSSSPPTLELERRSSDSLSDSDSGDDDKDLEDPGDIRLALLPQSSRPNHHSIASSSPIGTEEESIYSIIMERNSQGGLFFIQLDFDFSRPYRYYSHRLLGCRYLVGELLELISTWN